MEALSLFQIETDPLDGPLHLLWQTPGWPQDEIKDRAFLAALQQEFPRKDLAREIAAWHVWLQKPENAGRLEKVVNWRGTVRTWFGYDGRWGAERRRAARAASDAASRTAPGEAGSFGGSSTRLEGF